MVHATLQRVWEGALLVGIKDEHDFVGQELLTVDFDEFFQFYNQKALDKSLVACYCL